MEFCFPLRVKPKTGGCVQVIYLGDDSTRTKKRGTKWSEMGNEEKPN